VGTQGSSEGLGRLPLKLGQIALDLPRQYWGNAIPAERKPHYREMDGARYVTCSGALGFQFPRPFSVRLLQPTKKAGAAAYQG
jgi:hypothetical protein